MVRDSGGPGRDGAVDRAESEARSGVETLARAGYAAKGVVYILVGILALRAAIGAGGRTTGSEGALASLADEPFGQIALVIIGMGLAGYAIWRFVSAFLDPEHPGDASAGAGKRTFYFITGALYGLLAIEAIRMGLGDGGAGSGSGGAGGGGAAGGGSSASHWSAEVMQQPWGVWLVGIAGLLILGYGLHQLYKAYTVDLADQLALSRLGASGRTWAIRTGRAGLAARGIVFSVIGFFIIQAAIQSQPDQARGLGGALETLESQPYGPWILGAVAIGLAAYGVYMLVTAKYRRIYVG